MMSNISRKYVNIGDGPFYAVNCSLDGYSGVVPHLVFSVFDDAEKARKKRDKHPNSAALGATHAVVEVWAAPVRWTEKGPT